ncbi:MAG: tryptophan 2,3-dioxygenase family protein [Pseudonocardiaceae bacterium]
MRPGSYPELDNLPAPPSPRSSPIASEELLFITVHQVFELWLRHLLLELVDARNEMLAGRTYGPRVRLARCGAIERMLHEQFDVLDSMTTPELLRFRNAPGTASRAQSVQFIEVEFLSGLKDPCYAQYRDWLTVADHKVLQRRFAEPSLWDGFLAVLREAGFDVSTREHRSAAYRAIARDREKHGAQRDLLKAMIGHDQSWWLWRTRHVLAAERHIGTESATNGSIGVFPPRFYPELWQLRNQL